ncbi:uncharacterized protein LOC106469031 [Limulus polyphemus]|uniref:Uncharacterized protein LOC106469031 n=1 Tax=Limulus polyphemus TaxID=6850 RepID=A0ABM1TDL9_LIMPO|nr:uncharacterized protein LOC106469031 [Limulus polyphemus]
MNSSKAEETSQLPPPSCGTTVVPRSPSHDSFATDLSLISLSSLGSEIGQLRSSMMRTSRNGEGPEESLRQSPLPAEFVWGRAGAKGSRGSKGSLFLIPSEQHAPVTKRTISGEVLFEEETEVIRNCGALSSFLGLMKSFSTSDITQIITEESGSLRPSTSELALCDWEQFDLSNARLDNTSRSLSTWVAVGDVASSSHMASPLPQFQFGSLSSNITPAELVRSVNKKVRQRYIRRRILSTYKALERLTHSEVNLLKVSKQRETRVNVPKVQISSDLDRRDVQLPSLSFRGPNKNLTLTVKDIDREKGRPLTKYERNIMIFNWLQNLEENTLEVS